MADASTILETAIERRLEGGSSRPDTSRTVACPFCGATFRGPSKGSAASDVARHIGSEHPLSAPTLLLGGIPAGRKNLIGEHPDPASIVGGNFTHFEMGVDGSPLKASNIDELRERLASAATLVVRVKMANRRPLDGSEVTSEFELLVDVASPEELDAIDSAFLDQLAQGESSPDELAAFARLTQGLPKRYLDGLYRFVLAIQQKDGRALVVPEDRLDAARDSFRSAIETLAGYPGRPVAAAALAVAKLGLNDLSYPASPTPLPEIEGLSELLRGIAKEGSEASPRWPASESDEVGGLRFPIDYESANLLQVVSELQSSTADDVAAAQLARVDSAVMTGEDRTKLVAVIGEWAFGASDAPTLARCANLLRNDAVFSACLSRWEPR